MNAFKKKLSKVYKKLKIHTHYFNRIRFNKRTHKKRIIICFDGLFPHGGFVDRLKGILSFYEISKLLDYEFYIQFDDPFELKLFLEPNKIDWYMAKEAVSWEPFSTNFLYLVNDFDARPLDILKNSNADTFIVYANIDYFKTYYNKFTESQLEDKWRTSFTELFRKSDDLVNKLKMVEQEKYISIHSRFTSLMGDFKDTTKKVLSETQKQELLQKLRSIIKGIIDSSPYKCYAFSDSVNFLNFITEKEAVHLVEGVPVHMDDLAGKSSLDSHLKTILDFFAIANSEAVFFIKSDPMYHSSFSKYAAIVGNKPFKTVIN